MGPLGLLVDSAFFALPGIEPVVLAGRFWLGSVSVSSLQVTSCRPTLCRLLVPLRHTNSA